jgi:hypothetical protein
LFELILCGFLRGGLPPRRNPHKIASAESGKKLQKKIFKEVTNRPQEKNLRKKFEGLYLILVKLLITNYS